MAMSIESWGVGDVLDVAPIGGLGVDLAWLEELGVEDEVAVVGAQAVGDSQDAQPALLWPEVWSCHHVEPPD
jgi:hypothetical protein